WRRALYCCILANDCPLRLEPMYPVHGLARLGLVETHTPLLQCRWHRVSWSRGWIATPPATRRPIDRPGDRLFVRVLVWSPDHEGGLAEHLLRIERSSCPPQFSGLSQWARGHILPRCRLAGSPVRARTRVYQWPTDSRAQTGRDSRLAKQALSAGCG